MEALNVPPASINHGTETLHDVGAAILVQHWCHAFPAGLLRPPDKALAWLCTVRVRGTRWRWGTFLARHSADAGIVDEKQLVTELSVATTLRLNMRATFGSHCMPRWAFHFRALLGRNVCAKFAYWRQFRDTLYKTRRQTLMFLGIAPFVVWEVRHFYFICVNARISPNFLPPPSIHSHFLDFWVRPVVFGSFSVASTAMIKVRKWVVAQSDAKDQSRMSLPKGCSVVLLVLVIITTFLPAGKTVFNVAIASLKLNRRANEATQWLTLSMNVYETCW